MAKSLAIALRAAGKSQAAIAKRLQAAGMEVERWSLGDWLGGFATPGKSARNATPPAVASEAELDKIQSEILDWARNKAGSHYASPTLRSARPTQSRSSARVRPQERASGGVPHRYARNPIAHAALHKWTRSRSRCRPVTGS